MKASKFVLRETLRAIVGATPLDVKEKKSEREAIEATDRAIQQLELCLEYDKD
jgi:hypothetical protein